jgi:hypothetical protein
MDSKGFIQRGGPLLKVIIMMRPEAYDWVGYREIPLFLTMDILTLNQSMSLLLCWC